MSHGFLEPRSTFRRMEDCLSGLPNGLETESYLRAPGLFCACATSNDSRYAKKASSNVRLRSSLCKALFTECKIFSRTVYILKMIWPTQLRRFGSALKDEFLEELFSRYCKNYFVSSLQLEYILNPSILVKDLSPSKLGFVEKPWTLRVASIRAQCQNF